MYMAVQMGFRNVLLGFVHTLFDNNYKLKIGVLILTEICFLLLTVILVARTSIFVSHLKVWINIFAMLMRILLVLTFFFDKDNVEADIK
jgi:hypothetical protein